MPFVKTLNEKNFLTAIPPKPQGRFAHCIVLRVTESYALFQTDGELNYARVSAGVQNTEPLTRLVLFKRKQSSPERLVGRALLRAYGLYDQIAERKKGEGKKDKKKGEGESDFGVCDYNVSFCMRCPDCIAYGFAIGDSGSEKSKVVTDTAYSLTPFDNSHETFTLNAPFEDGTMSRAGETTSRINSQDHVLPQVYFPSIITLKDPTEAGFLYVLNNIQRTKHYGAQTTRTGRVRNLMVGAVFTDGEIVSNLRLTQAIFDHLKAAGTKLDGVNPISEHEVVQAMTSVLPDLLKQDGVVVFQSLLGSDWTSAGAEIQELLTQEDGLRAVLQAALRESNEYAERYIFTKGK